MEEEITFSRFGDDKQEQIRQLVSYCTLMGLTGKDLISIGGKLDRMKASEDYKKNLEIGLSYPVTPVKNFDVDSVWDYTDSQGARWRFRLQSSWQVQVTNMKSGKRQTFYLDRYVKAVYRNYRANVMLNVHYGGITLNF